MDWAIPESPRPAYLLFESISPGGWPVWCLPPHPWGDPRKQLLLYDWVHEHDLWMSGLAPRNSGADRKELAESNFERNKRFGFKDWQKLWGRERGKRCLLLSCGPSLRDSAAEIAKERKKANTFTLAINKAISFLKPDYYCAVDRRGDPSWRVGNCRSTTLIASTTVSRHAVMNTYKDKFWGEGFLTKETAEVAPITTRMPLTICDAMFAAYKLGARELWLYGCDYSISGDGDGLDQPNPRYYFDTSTQEAMALGARGGDVPGPVRGIGDKVVFVTWELVAYAAYTTAMACMLARGGMDVRNRSPRGILWETWRG